MTTKLESVTDVIYDELGVLAGSMGRALSERTAKKVLTSLSEYWGEVADGKREPEAKVTTYDTPVEVKRCESCERDLPLTKFPTLPSKKATLKPKRGPICRECRDANAKERKAAAAAAAAEQVLPDVHTLQDIRTTTDPRIPVRNRYVKMRLEQGALLAEVAEELNLSGQRLSQIAAKLGLSPGRNPGARRNTAPAPAPVQAKKPGRKAQIDRDEVARRLTNGETQKQVAVALGVTRQAVNNIANRELEMDTQQLIAQREKIDAERRDKLAVKVREYLKENPNASREEVLREVGISDKDRAGVLTRVGHKFPKVQSSDRVYQQRWSDEEMLKILRRIKRKAGSKILTAQAYESLRSKATDPSVPSYYLRFGSWTDACKQAGIKAGVGRSEYGKKYTPARVNEILNDWIATLNGEYPSYREYETWSRNQDNVPAGTTVRKTFTGLRWSDIIKQAQA